MTIAARCPSFDVLFCFIILMSFGRAFTEDIQTNLYNYYTTQPYLDDVQEVNTLPNIPKIPDGNKHFQFYTLDADGNQQKQWMSLQEVQHIILAHAYQNHPKFKVQSLYRRPQYDTLVNNKKKDEYLLKLLLKNSEKKPETSVEDVLANVQKVMSKEITKTYLSGNFPTSPTVPEGTDPVTDSTVSDHENQTAAQNITIPDTILAHLMKEQVASLETHNPWGILTTPAIGGSFNTVFHGVDGKRKGITTTEVPSEDGVSLGENFIEGNEIKTTGNFNPISQTEHSYYDDTESLLRLNPNIFDSTTEVPTASPTGVTDNASEMTEKFISNKDALETTTNIRIGGSKPQMSNNNKKVNNENEITFPTLTTKWNKLESDFHIFENLNSDKEFYPQTTRNPYDTWSTANSIIYKKPKPTYTMRPVTDLGGTLNSLNDATLHAATILHEDTTLDGASYNYKSNKDSNTLPTTESVKGKSDFIVPMTTPSYLSVVDAAQSTDLNTIEELLHEHIENKFEPSLPQGKFNNHNIRSKLTNSKFSSNEEGTESPKEFLNRFKDAIENDPLTPATEETKRVQSSNVLSPSEIAKGSQSQVGKLGVEVSKDSVNYSYDDTAIYLEDIPEIDYDFVDTSGTKNPPKSVDAGKLNFPSANVVDSYHKPDHISHNIDSVGQPKPDGSYTSFDPDDPLQFLPAYNPAIAQRENPLKATPLGNIGLEETVASLDSKIKEHIDSMNDISFEVYKKAAAIHRRQNMVMAPINLISALSMLLLGARGPTADALSKLLKFDELLTFNPHLILKNVTESLIGQNLANHEAAAVNNIFIEKSNRKSHSLDFFDQTMDFFYGAKINEVPEGRIGPTARDQANAAIRRQTQSAVHNFLKPNASLKVVGPLSVVSSAYFQGDWGIGINEKDLIDMSFIRFPSAERRLIKTVGVERRMNINAGYSQEMDATVAEVPLDGTSKEVSLILVMPGQQKSFVANGLSQLEQGLTSKGWSKLLRAVLPHTINFKMPIFSHRNYLNLSGILSMMGLNEMFAASADFSGINGLKSLHLGDVVQLSEFHSCKLEMKSLTPSNVRDDEANSKLFKRGVKSKPVDEADPNHSQKKRFRYLKMASDFVSKRQDAEMRNQTELGINSFEDSKMETPSKDGSENTNPTRIGYPALTGYPALMDPTVKASPALNTEGGTREGRQNDRISSYYRNDDTLAYDRAFFYVLRHNPTGLILFIGRYLDPETF